MKGDFVMKKYPLATTQIPPDAQLLILYAPAYCENSKRDKSEKG